MIDAKSAFGILADGSDETTKIAAALAAGGDTGTGDEVYFGPGIYGVNNLPAIDRLVNFRGAGNNKTIFKNLSSTARMFEFVGLAGSDWNSAFALPGNFTIDQNGCTGNAVELNAMFSGLSDCWIKNQGGAGYGVKAKNMTQGQLKNVHVTGSTNGILLDTCYYPYLENCSVERSTGVGVRMVGCASVNASSLYLDHGNAGSVGSNSPELLQIEGCTTVNINGLACEMGTSSNLVPNRYFWVLNSSNVNFNGGRINQYASESSSYMFYSQGSSTRIRGFEWFENQATMIFAGVSGDNESIALEDITTYLSSPGSRYGLGCWEGRTGRVRITNWTDRYQVPETNIHAFDTVCQQVTSKIVISSAAGAKGTYINCREVGGAGAASATLIGCN